VRAPVSDRAPQEPFVPRAPRTISVRTLSALTLTVALTGLAGCGGGGPSKAEYIAQVDPICAKYQTEAERVTPPTSQEGAALASYYDQIAGVADRQVSEIDGIDRPKEGKAQMDDLLKRQRAQINQIRQLSAALRANDQPKASQISAAAEPDSDKIQSDLKAFGFTKCGSS
jgi:hypothetical protein